jgi:hypothetical protein
VPHPEDPNPTIGFPQGAAETLLLKSFRQFPLRRLPKSSAQSIAKQKPAGEAATKTAAAAAPPVSSKPAPSEKQKTKATTKGSIRYTEEGLQVPIGNGGSSKLYNFTWTQNLDECSVLIPVPDDTRGKDVDVEMKSTYIRVKLKENGHVLMEGNLKEKINISESTWTLEGSVLVLILYKHMKAFWAAILENDEHIDTTQVDSRRKIDTYDEATQAQIRKLIFDQNQARKGMSSSDEILGKVQTVPEQLPKGVEYIDQKKLDEFHSAKKNGDSVN